VEFHPRAVVTEARIPQGFGRHLASVLIDDRAFGGPALMSVHVMKMGMAAPRRKRLRQPVL
jgi:hypothetical protein